MEIIFSLNGLQLSTGYRRFNIYSTMSMIILLIAVASSSSYYVHPVHIYPCFDCAPIETNNFLSANLASHVHSITSRTNF